MRHTEQIAKPACTSKAGLSAVLGALLNGKGSGAPKTCRGSGASKISRTLSIAVLVVASLAFTTAPAFAELGHGFTAAFGTKGPAAGQLEDPQGVAVNDTTTGPNAGDVYVVDKGNNRIDEFESDGTFIRAWGWDVDQATPEAKLQECTTATGCQPGEAGTGTGQLDAPEAIAVDNSGNSLDPSVEDVYVTNTGDGEAVEKFSATGKYEGQLPLNGTGICFKPPESASLCSVAVDPAGNVWVDGKVHGGEEELSGAEFSDAGKFEKHFTAFNHPGLAVDSSDNLYEVNQPKGFGMENDVRKWNPTTETTIAEFSETNPSGLAIDPAENDLYVDNGGSIARYGPFGEPYATPVEEFASEQLREGGGGSGLAVDFASGTVYVADSTGDDVEVYSVGPTPEAPLTEAPEPFEPTRETLKGQLNPHGATGALKYQFDYNQGASCTGGQSIPVPAGEVAEAKEAAVQATAEHLQPESEYTYCLVAKGTYGSTQGNEVMFRTPEPIYPEEPTGLEANPIAATTATLKGVLNPNNKGETGTYEFSYSQSAVQCGGPNQKVVKGLATGVTPEPVEAKVTGLLPNLPYTFCLRTKNEAEQYLFGEPKTFTTLAEAPTVAGESVSAVEASAATLGAEVVPEGAVTTAHFEYLTEAQFESGGETFTGATTTPQSASIGADDTAHVVEARITALQPGTTYDYRVVAQNEVEGKTETVYGPDKALTTSPPASSTVENCPNAQSRAEQPFGLTLPDCRAYEIVSPLETVGQDATDSFVNERPRAAVSGEAITYSSKGSFGGAVGEVVENQFLSRRDPEKDGWETQPITPPHDPITTAPAASYLATVFTPELTQGIAMTNGRLTGEAPVPESESELLYQANFAGSSYRYVGQAAYPLGASTDLSHVVFGGSEWVNGKVVPVTVANNGAGLGASIGTQRYDASGGDAEVWHAVSADGSRVYFTSPAYTYHAPTPGQLYLRENAEQEQSKLGPKEECLEPAQACTIEVSASQRLLANPAGAQTAHYWGASADGSKVFFTSTAELTEDAYTGSAGQGANLYEYDLARPEGQRLRDLTGEAIDKTGDGAAVWGVEQISEDGAYVYFVAEGALGTEPNTQGAHAEPGQLNLYVSHEGGPPKFIATRAAGVSETLEGKDAREDRSGPATNSAVVSPDGTQLAFTSERSLTGYDNEVAEGLYQQTCEREAAEKLQNGVTPPNCKDASEIYLYNAATGGLVCASCNPSGVRPLGPSSFGRYDDFSDFSSVQYQERNLLEDGTLFFDSSDALVPHASDGRQNVYEYERGQIHAISDVAGGYESFFMDASANGENVFFGSADQLLPRDKSQNVEVWDARVDGGFPEAAALPSCDNADSCKPPESPQPGAFAAPASATFSGHGNPPPPPPALVKKVTTKKLVKCKKNFVKNKKSKCVKKPKKKKNKAEKSAHTNRRASR